jgi:hypothetical protein
MKLSGVQEAGSVQVMAPGVQRTFQIHNNIKSFRILSDGLYSDKITAVIRELSCNAWDSHVAAGKKTVPFEVHFPTGLEPWFSVRDFGIGLCEEDIYDLYTTYFSSSKDQSNEFIGALGLGSKSPFSYCETFTVTSNFNGSKQIFSAFISEEGLPTIIKMHEETTTEGNGLEVKFPVKRDDISNFHYKGANVFEFFEVAPKHNLSGQRIPKNDYILKGIVDGCWWGIRAGAGNVRAVMGSISYPLDLSGHGLSSEEQTVAACGIDIQFNLGDLEIAASREKLSFNKITIANVTKRYRAIFEQMNKEIHDKLDAATTVWDARKALFLMTNDQSVGRIVRNLIQTNSIKGKYTNFEFDGSTSGSFKATEYPELNVIGVSPASGIWAKKNLYSSDYKVKIEASSSQRFILNDMFRGHNQILAELVKDGSRFIMLTPRKLKDLSDDEKVEAAKLAAEQVEKFMANFEGAKLEKISDYHDLLEKRVPGEKKTRIRKNYFHYVGNKTWGGSFEHIPDAEFDTATDGDVLFFPIHNMKPAQDRMEQESAEDFSTFIYRLRQAGIIGKDTKLVAYKVREEFEISEPEKDLLTFVDETIAKKLTDPKIASYYNDDNSFTVPDLFNSYEIWNTRKGTKGQAFFATKFGALMAEYREYKDGRDKNSEFIRMCYTLGIKKQKSMFTKDLADKCKKVATKYPMLSLLQTYYIANNLEILTDYLNLVDSQ